MSRLRPLFWTCGLVALLAVTGCFETRTPEDPNNADTVPRKPRTDPDSVLWNIATCIEFKSPTAYMEQIGTLFTFIPDPADVSAFDDPTLFNDWDRAREEIVLGDILTEARAQNLTSKLVWGTDRDRRDFNDGVASGQWYEDLDYTITFVSTLRRTTYSGRVDLYFVESNALWEVYKWTDKVDGSVNRSSGYLRGRQQID